MRLISKLDNSSIFLLGGMILSMTAAQVLFKYAGNYMLGQSSFIIGLFLNFWLWFGLLISGVGMLFWVLILRKLPLSRAYPWTAFVYVLTPLISVVLFDDVLSVRYLLGLSCIVAGIFLTAGSVSSS